MRLVDNASGGVTRTDEAQQGKVDVLLALTIDHVREAPAHTRIIGNLTGYEDDLSLPFGDGHASRPCEIVFRKPAFS